MITKLEPFRSASGPSFLSIRDDTSGGNRTCSLLTAEMTEEL
jgi:hypothetical protein